MATKSSANASTSRAPARAGVSSPTGTHKRKHVTPSRADEDKPASSGRTEKPSTGPYTQSELIKDTRLRGRVLWCIKERPSLRATSYAIPRLPWLSGLMLADAFVANTVHAFNSGDNQHALLTASLPYSNSEAMSHDLDRISQDSSITSSVKMRTMTASR